MKYLDSKSPSKSHEEKKDTINSNVGDEYWQNVKLIHPPLLTLHCHWEVIIFIEPNVGTHLLSTRNYFLLLIFGLRYKCNKRIKCFKKKILCFQWNTHQCVYIMFFECHKYNYYYSTFCVSWCYDNLIRV